MCENDDQKLCHYQTCRLMITRDSVTEKLKLTTMNSSNLLKFVIATVLSTRVSSDQLMIVFPDDNYVAETDQTYYAYAPPQDSYQQCRYCTFQILFNQNPL